MKAEVHPCIVSDKLKKNILTMKQTLDDLVHLTLNGYEAPLQGRGWWSGGNWGRFIIFDYVQKSTTQGKGFGFKIVYPSGPCKNYLANFIANITKYCQEGRPPVVAVATEKNEMKMVLQVLDNGQGMDEQRTEIFKPFKRLASGGLGNEMGLIVIKEQVIFITLKSEKEGQPLQRLPFPEG